MECPTERRKSDAESARLREAQSAQRLQLRALVRCSLVGGSSSAVHDGLTVLWRWESPESKGLMLRRWAAAIDRSPKSAAHAVSANPTHASAHSAFLCARDIFHSWALWRLVTPSAVCIFGRLPIRRTPRFDKVLSRSPIVRKSPSPSKGHLLLLRLQSPSRPARMRCYWKAACVRVPRACPVAHTQRSDSL